MCPVPSEMRSQKPTYLGGITMKRKTALLVVLLITVLFSTLSSAFADDVLFPGKPQIKKPIEGKVEEVDVVKGIDSEEGKTFPQYNWKFALHSYDPGYENSATIANDVRAECAKYGISVIESYCNMDVSKYPANYQQFILQEVDLIIDAGWLGNSSIMDIAAKAEIPVVTFDVNFDADRESSGPRGWAVGGDPAVAGRTIGTYMAKLVKEKWGGEVDYVVISWTQAMGEIMRVRMQSAIDAMVANGLVLPENIIFWYDGGGETVKSKNLAADFLTAHPDAKKILFGANTDNVAQGILAAVQTAGREDDVMIYSYGAEQVAIDNFSGERNCWVASVGYYFKQYGWLAVNTAIRVMNGESIGYWISPENFVVDYDTLSEYRGR